MGPRLRLTSGIDLLEEWSVTAHQADRNIVYRALFAVADGSVHMSYDVIGRRDGRKEFLVLLKDDLVAHIRLHRCDCFGIAYIGPCDVEGAAFGELPLGDVA